MPERKEEILKNGRYLAKYIEAIAIRKTDIEANNGKITGTQKILKLYC